MGLLDHNTAVITGANSGIGLATAARFIADWQTAYSLPIGGNPN